jgi:hypothetical protein
MTDQPKTFMDRAVAGEISVEELLGEMDRTKAEGKTHHYWLGMTQDEWSVVMDTPCSAATLTYIVERRREEAGLRARALIAEEEARMLRSGATVAMALEKCGEALQENAALRALVQQAECLGVYDDGRERHGACPWCNSLAFVPHLSDCPAAKVMGWRTE